MVHATIKRLQIFRVSSLGFLLPPRRVIFVSSPACTQAHTQAFSFVLSFLSLPFIANFSSLVQSSHALSRTHFFVSRKLIARRPLYTASHCSLCLSSVSISPRSVLFFFSLYLSLFSLSSQLPFSISDTTSIRYCSPTVLTRNVALFVHDEKKMDERYGWTSVVRKKVQGKQKFEFVCEQ